MFGLKQGRLRERVMLFIYRRTGVKMGNVGANGKIDPKFVPVHRIVVVLSDSLAHFTGDYADNRIIVAVVVRSPAEKLAAENSFFETILLSVERFADDMPEKWGISFTLAEEGTRQHPLQLIDDQSALLHTQRHSSDHGIFGCRHRSGFF